MTDTPLCSCSRPIKDHAYLCTECSDTLEKRLAEIPALADDLETTRTRTSRTGGRGIGIIVRGTETPVPWDDRAARMAERLKVALVGWAKVCEDFRQSPEGATCRRCLHPSCVMLRSFAHPGDTAEALSRYLLASLPALRHRPEVTACADDLDTLTKAAELVIDRPPEQTYFGPCNSIDYIDGEPDPNSVPCPADLYGPEKAADITCRVCTTEHAVTDRREMLLEHAQDQLATAVDLSRFLTAYSDTISPERIRKWVERDLLVAHGTDRNGRPVYRVSEAIACMAKMDRTRRASA